MRLRPLPAADQGSRLAAAATQKISSKQRLAMNFLMLQRCVDETYFIKNTTSRVVRSGRQKPRAHRIHCATKHYFLFLLYKSVPLPPPWRLFLFFNIIKTKLFFFDRVRGTLQEKGFILFLRVKNYCTMARKML